MPLTFKQLPIPTFHHYLFKSIKIPSTVAYGDDEIKEPSPHMSVHVNTKGVVTANVNTTKRIIVPQWHNRAQLKARIIYIL